MLQLASLLRSRCSRTTYAANTRKIFNVISATSAKCFYYSSPGGREGRRDFGVGGGWGVGGGVEEEMGEVLRLS